MEKQKLKQTYEQKLQEAKDENVPTAFVLVEYRDELVIESFPVQDFINQTGGIEDAVLMVNAEAAMYSRRVWVIGIFGQQFALESDAFELAWDNREYFHDQRKEYGASA